jgi:hypothetical protein
MMKIIIGLLGSALTTATTLLHAGCMSDIGGAKANL